MIAFRSCSFNFIYKTTLAGTEEEQTKRLSTYKVKTKELSVMNKNLKAKVCNLNRIA